MAQIVLQHVCKTYRVSKRKPGMLGALKGAFTRETTQIRAADDISFSIEPGELVGYIGPNGAGKSTTVKMMSGILVPDAGEVRILGRIPHKQRKEHVSHIGVVFGQRSQLWWDTPVMDSFHLLRDIYRVRESDFKRRLEELTGMLDAQALLHVPVRQLSLGQRMKCELIAALLHDPEILFLDEPTIGLDAVTKLNLRAFLRAHNQKGVTMVLTTHDMDDISALCSRVMVIGKGRLLFDGDMAEMRRRYAPARVIKARFEADVAPFALEGAQSVEMDGRAVKVTFLPEQAHADALIASLASRGSLADLTVEDTDVEELVADMYKEMDG